LVPLLRSLQKQPGFSLLAILTLALGIGVNVAIFSALRTLVLQPLPYAEPDRLVAVYEDASWIGYSKNTPAPANYIDWRREAKSFEDIAATSYCRAVLTGDGAPEEVLCRNVTANLWPMLGVKPILGRWFTTAEDHPQPDTAVIGEGLWTRRFGRDPGILQRTVQINGRAFRVTGIMPAWFRFGEEKELWLPTGFTPEQLSKRGNHYLSCYGRLKHGVAPAAAEAELRAIQTHINKLYPRETDPRLGAAVEPLQDALVGKTGTALWVLMGASVTVLLIGCFNVANLLLARGAARQREMAVRTAVGAGASDLFLQVLMETVMLAAAGGALGVALALASRRLLENFIPPGLKGTVSIHVDASVMAFAAGVCVLSALFAAVIPIWHVVRSPLMDLLRQDSRTGSARGTVRLRSVLVVGEVALTVALLAGAGLMIRSLIAIWNTSIGFKPEGLLTVRVSLPRTKYADDTKRGQFYERALERVRATPGVISADFTSTPPFFSIGNSKGFAVEGQTPSNQWERGDMLIRVATAGYLQTIGATLAEGRYFTDADREGAPDVVVINETFARTFFPNESAIGKRMSFTPEEEGFQRQWRTVVGVVKEVRERGYDPEPKTATYVPSQQMRDWSLENLVVRSATGSPLSLIPSIRQVVLEIDPDQPLGRAQTFEEVLALDQASRRQQMFLLGAFASLSLVMACLGIYAILAFTVELRRQEIGVRMALGADPAGVMRLVVGGGMRLAAVGALIGTGLAAVMARVLQSSLYGVRPFDIPTWAGVCGVLGAVALVACAIPAARAARTDPAAALRS
jgi:putative ABC transport system permease protein